MGDNATPKRHQLKDINLPISVIFKSQTLEALAAEIKFAQDPVSLCTG